MKSLMTSLFMATALLFAGDADAEDLHMGFVNFKACVEKSKQGVQEKNAFENLQNQMSSQVEKTEKELTELAQKLEDQDYLDGLSPTAEQELKEKFQMLNQEFARYQNQYYQLLNQANYKMMQKLHAYVSEAAEKVRKKEELDLILSEDSTFAFAPTLNITDRVVEEMDRRFEIENSETASTDS